MKKTALSGLLAFLLIGGLATLSFKKEANEAENESEEIAQAAQFWNMMRKNVNTGKFEEADYYNALTQLKSFESHKSGAKSLNLKWTSLGPTNIGGRVRAILIDKNNVNHLLCGGVTGGLWVSNDAGATWNKHPQCDQLVNMGVTALAQSVNGDIYMGTGEYIGSNEVFLSNGGVVGNLGFPGYGVFKSTDGGNTFTHLASTTPSTSATQWQYIDAIACDNADNDLVYIATWKGAFKTINGGTAFTRPTGLTAASWCTDIKVATNGNVIAFLGGTSATAKNAYTSTDHGATFSSHQISSSIGFNRAKFTISPQDPNYIYCGASYSATNSTAGVYRSTDAGLTWTAIAPAGSSTFNPYNQFYYSMSLAVSPSNKNRIFTGGLDLWQYDNTGWSKSSSWNSSEASATHLHADHHVVAFSPTDPNTFYAGTDGGVYVCNNANSGSPTFQSRNKGLGITQMYGIGAGLSGDVIGGAQDNGSMYNDYSGIVSTYYAKVKGGDGYQCAISHINPKAVFASTYGDASTNKPLARSLNGTISFGGMLDSHIDNDNNDNPDEGGFFVTRMYLWEKLKPYSSTADSISSSRLYMPTRTGVWVAINALATSPVWYKITPSASNPNPANGDPISNALSFMSSKDGNTLFVGTEDGNVYRIDSLNTNYPLTYSGNFLSTPAASAPGARIRSTRIYAVGRAVTGIAIDPVNSNNIVISSAEYGATSYITKITNAMTTSSTATTTSASVQGDLPLMPCYDIVVNPMNNNQAIVATELGVFSCANIWAAGAITWADENGSFPHVPTMQLLFSQNAKNEWWLFAGTHGRGIFYTKTLCGACDSIALPNTNSTGIDQLDAPSSLTVYPNPAQEQINLEITSNTATTGYIQVYSMQGVLMYNEKMPLTNGVNKTTLSINNYAAGNYLVQLKYGNQTTFKKFIKL
jgi:hypothetical protein